MANLRWGEPRHNRVIHTKAWFKAISDVDPSKPTRSKTNASKKRAIVPGRTRAPLAEVIRRLRQRKGMTQRELAKKSGYPESLIRLVEMGRGLTPAEMRRISAGLGVFSVDRLTLATRSRRGKFKFGTSEGARMPSTKRRRAAK